MDIFYNFMQGVQDLLGGELHDLSIEVDDPNHLFLFLQHPLTDVDQSLIGVSGELIVIEHFMQLVDFNIADPVDHYGLPVFVLAAEAVLVYLFHAINPLSVEIILYLHGGTSFSDLKCRYYFIWFPLWCLL